MRNKYLWIGAAVALFVFPYAGCIRPARSCHQADAKRAWGGL